jgi:hypothetical protein
VGAGAGGVCAVADGFSGEGGVESWVDEELRWRMCMNIGSLQRGVTFHRHVDMTEDANM